MRSGRAAGVALVSVLTLAGCGQPKSGPVISDGSSSLWSDVSRAAEARWQPNAPLSIETQITMVDDYGGERVIPALTLSWTQADLAAIARDKADGWLIVNLAEVRIDGDQGVIALHAWCTEGQGPALTPRLCRYARPRADDAWALHPEADAAKRGSGVRT